MVARGGETYGIKWGARDTGLGAQGKEEGDEDHHWEEEKVAGMRVNYGLVADAVLLRREHEGATRTLRHAISGQGLVGGQYGGRQFSTACLDAKQFILMSAGGVFVLTGSQQEVKPDDEIVRKLRLDPSVRVILGCPQGGK